MVYEKEETKITQRFWPKQLQVLSSYSILGSSEERTYAPERIRSFRYLRYEMSAFRWKFLLGSEV